MADTGRHLFYVARLTHGFSLDVVLRILERDIAECDGYFAPTRLGQVRWDL